MQMEKRSQTSVREMETVTRLLKLALPLASKSESYVVCAIIQTAIDLSATRLAGLKADASFNKSVPIK